jgi:phosphonate metabolism protein (transferase hexapeptide repeat family)
MTRLSESKPFLHPECNVSNCSFGRYTEIGHGTRLQNTDLGSYSYTDRYADVANTRIRKFANIAAFFRIGPTAHPMELASMHHMLYRSDDYWSDTSRWVEFFRKQCVARNHVRSLYLDWIASTNHARSNYWDWRCSCRGAVVTKDVAPYMIVAGIPATPIRERFSAGIANRMQALSWWNWVHNILRDALFDFRALQAEEFIAKYE